MKVQSCLFAVCIALSWIATAIATDTNPKTDDRTTTWKFPLPKIHVEGITAQELKNLRSRGHFQVHYVLGKGDDSHIFDGPQWIVRSISVSDAGSLVFGHKSDKARNFLLSSTDLETGGLLSQELTVRCVQLLKDLCRSNKRAHYDVQALIRPAEKPGELHLVFKVAEIKYLECIEPGSLIYEYPGRMSS